MFSWCLFCRSFFFFCCCLFSYLFLFFFFFFQAEDGIRDPLVTGVQTCALPISFFIPFPNLAGTFGAHRRANQHERAKSAGQIGKGNKKRIAGAETMVAASKEIGRASCRERV